MKHPNNLPDFRDELRELRKDMCRTCAKEDQLCRMDELLDCLLDIIVDEMRN